MAPNRFYILVDIGVGFTLVATITRLRDLGRVIVTIVRTSEDRNSAKLNGIVARSRMNHSVMKYAIAYAMSTDFAAMTPPPLRLVEMVRHLFRGWAQSRINEKGNKVLRETELRGSNGKALAS